MPGREVQDTLPAEAPNQVDFVLEESA